MEPDNIVKQIKEAAEKAASAPSFPGMERVWARVEEKLDAGREQPRVIPFRRKLAAAAAAAAVLLLGSASFYFLKQDAPAPALAYQAPPVSPAGVPASSPVSGNPETPVVVAGSYQPDNGPEATVPQQANQKDQTQGKLHATHVNPVREEIRDGQVAGQIAGNNTVNPAQAAPNRQIEPQEIAGKDAYGNVLITDIARALEASPGARPAAGLAGTANEPRIQVKRQFSIGDDIFPIIDGSAEQKSPVIVRMNPSPEAVYDGVRNITGRILDENGNGIPGVSISIKGASFSAVTDVAGGYAIRLPLEADTLIVAAMGADTAFVPMGNSSQLVVTLPSSPAELLLPGKKDIARSTYYKHSDNKLASKMINQMPVADIVRVLEDAVPGMEVVPGVSSPGGATQLRIGKADASAAGGAPLIVVDGKVHEGSLVIDPRMIRSFTFLKEQSGVAMYGARGVNGVIVITTEKSMDTGKKGRKKK